MDILSEINLIINNNPSDSFGRILTKKSNKHIMEFLVNETSFLPDGVKSTERLYIFLNKLPNRPLCNTCNIKQVKFISYGQGYKSYCSKSCINKNPEVRQKIAQTNIERYGNICSLQGKTIREKVTKTFIEKYGVDHPMKNKDIVEQANKKTRINTYNNLSKFKDMVVPLFSGDEFQGTSYEIEYRWLCKKCNQEFNHYFHSHMPSCPSCKSVSSFEYEVNQFFESLSIPYERNTRTVITPHELDFYFPNLNIAIECNGNYWHSELFGRGKNYHLSKTEKCNDNGIQLIHIFEDEWLLRSDIVKSKLKSILGLLVDRIPARKCVVKEVPTSHKTSFLNQNHLQGTDKSNIKLGLYYNDNLVSIMTFCKLRKSLGTSHKEGSWELSRFCNKLDTTVIGGASKLFKHFKVNYEWNYIKSFADRRWSKGRLYFNLGFNLSHFSKPNYWYFKQSIERVHRFKYRKSQLNKLLDVYDENLTEWENMKINKFNRIWDCGNYVFGIYKENVDKKV